MVSISNSLLLYIILDADLKNRHELLNYFHVSKAFLKVFHPESRCHTALGSSDDLEAAPVAMGWRPQVTTMGPLY